MQIRASRANRFNGLPHSDKPLKRLWLKIVDSAPG